MVLNFFKTEINNYVRLLILIGLWGRIMLSLAQQFRVFMLCFLFFISADLFAYSNGVVTCTPDNWYIKLPPRLEAGKTYTFDPSDSTTGLLSCELNPNSTWTRIAVDPYPSQVSLNPLFQTTGTQLWLGTGGNVSKYGFGSVDKNITAGSALPVGEEFSPKGIKYYPFGKMQLVMPPGNVKNYSIKAGDILLSGRFYMREYRDDFYYSPDDIKIIAMNSSRMFLCDFNRSNTTVKLPSITLSELKNVGPKTVSKNFSLAYACDDAVISSVQLDGIADASAGSSVLASQTGTGYASGVGIQFVDDQGAVIELGKPYPFSAGGTSAEKMFSARYYQTKSAVTPGLVKGTATVTYTFQ